MLVTILTMIPAQNVVFHRGFRAELFFSIFITADDAVKPLQRHTLEPSWKAIACLCAMHKYLGG